MNHKPLLAMLLVLVAVPAVTATSFITDCQYEDWRANNSDVILTGTVTGFEEHKSSAFGEEAYGEITFDVINTTKGDVGQTFTLRQAGSYEHNVMIPALTLEWKQGDTYRLYAQEQENGYDLVCGVMGRTIIETQERVEQEPLTCRDIPAIALHPETDERVEYNSECNVPRGWTLVTRTATQTESCSTNPVIAMNEHGERQEYDSECDVPRGWSILHRAQNDEMCAQVITYAQNPETGDVTQFPTPCDVPKDWQVVDQPQPAQDMEETPEPSVWQKISAWFKGLF